MVYEIEKIDRSAFKWPRRKSKWADLPFESLKKPNDSFFVPLGNQIYVNLYNNLSATAKRRGFKISMRLDEKNGIKGLRIWKK